MSKKEYFAYGSNLNFEQMAYRCPEATVVGTAKLDGYELACRRGYLTILPKEGASVEGLIWSCLLYTSSRISSYCQPVDEPILEEIRKLHIASPVP